MPSGMYERPPEEDADEVAGAGAEVANDIGALAAIIGAAGAGLALDAPGPQLPSGM